MPGGQPHPGASGKTHPATRRSGKITEHGSGKPPAKSSLGVVRTAKCRRHPDASAPLRHYRHDCPAGCSHSRGGSCPAAATDGARSFDYRHFDAHIACVGPTSGAYPRRISFATGAAPCRTRPDRFSRSAFCRTAGRQSTFLVDAIAIGANFWLGIWSDGLYCSGTIHMEVLSCPWSIS